MRKPERTEADVIKQCRLEVVRCQRAVRNGSPAPFWIKRLGEAVRNLEAAATILRMQVEALACASGRGLEGGAR